MTSFKNESRFRSSHAWLNQDLGEHSITHVSHKKKVGRPHKESSRVVAQPEKPYQTMDLLKGFKRMGLNLSQKQLKRLEGVSGKAALESILDFSKSLRPPSVEQENIMMHDPNGSICRPHASFKGKKNDSTQAQKLIHQAPMSKGETVEPRPVSPSRAKRKQQLRGNQVGYHLQEDESLHQLRTKPLKHDVNRARYALSKKFQDLGKHDFGQLFKRIGTCKNKELGLNQFRSFLADAGLQMSVNDAQLLFAKTNSPDNSSKKSIDLDKFAAFARQAWKKEGHHERLSERERTKSSLKRSIQNPLQECYPFPQEAFEELRSKHGGVRADTIVDKFLPQIGIALGEEDKHKITELFDVDPDGKVSYNTFVETLYTDKTASPSLNKFKPKTQRQFRRGSHSPKMTVTPNKLAADGTSSIKRNLSASIDHIASLWNGKASPTARKTSPLHRNLHASVDHVDLSWGASSSLHPASPSRRRPRANTECSAIQSLLQPENTESAKETLDVHHLTSALGEGQQRRKFAHAQLQPRVKELLQGQPPSSPEVAMVHERAKPRSNSAARMSLGERVSSLLHQPEECGEDSMPRKVKAGAPVPPGATFGMASDFERTTRKRMLGVEKTFSDIFDDPQYPSNIVESRDRLTRS